MKKTYLVFMTLGLALFMSSLGWADMCWQIVYQTDFATNQGWQTNNANNYYLDSGVGVDPPAYHQKQIDPRYKGTEFPSVTSDYGEYSYHSLLDGVAVPFNRALGWCLEYDILPVDIPFCADSRIGLTDADMDASVNPPTPTYATINFAAGRVVDQYCTDEGNNGGDEHPAVPYTEGIWYTAAIEWDPILHKLYYSAKERDSGVLLYEISYDVVGSFSRIDRVAMTTVGDNWCPGATGVSYIDNVVVSQIPEPATLLLLGLGALVLRRRRR